MDGPHYNENMPERTSPKEALERLAWILNYHKGEKVSLNQIAEATGLSWATVQKYTKTIEFIQKIAPEIAVDNDGICVNRRTDIVSELFSDQSTAVAVYLLEQAEIAGDPTQPLELSEHANILEKHDEAVDKIEELGWIEKTDNTIQLTPLGIQIAGSARSDVMNSNRDYIRKEVRLQQEWDKAKGSTENKVIFGEVDIEQENTFEEDNDYRINPEEAAAT